jgi:sulfate transport system ATP-binding protein
MSIEVRGLYKTFNRYKALRDVSLEVKHGELLALLGPSGSGKTTLLRVIAGLEAPDRGQVLFGGEDATDRHVRDRQVGFVFQHYALFRHMNVYDNVAFGLAVRHRSVRPDDTEIRRRVDELLKLVQLDLFADRRPSKLSGGQRQRVALARALAVEPRILLLDEPFGALDARVRQELRGWLRRLHDRLGITSVFVTHDQEEALELADRVVIMDEGRIEQVGTPEEVFEHPATPFVMQFLGSVNVFRGHVQGGRAQLAGFEVEAPEHPSATGPAAGYCRPHDIRLERTASGPGTWAEVARVNAAGPLVRVELRGADEQIIRAEMTRERYGALKPAAGERLHVEPTALRIFLES